MCNQTQLVTLQTAVLIQVKEFAQNNQKFSVHDVTRSIRSKTANGELEIPEVEVTGASFRFDISHAKVKALFDELWRTGVFDPDFTLTRQFNNAGYFEYTPSVLNGVDPSQISTAPTPTPVPTPVAAPQPTVATPTATVTASHNVSSTNSIRIKTYLTNCATKKFQPTLRNVQSAIKRNDGIPIPSCDELKDYITSVLGHVVVDNPDSVSRAQVVTN